MCKSPGRLPAAAAAAASAVPCALRSSLFPALFSGCPVFRASSNFLLQDSGLQPSPLPPLPRRHLLAQNPCDAAAEACTELRIAFLQLQQSYSDLLRRADCAHVNVSHMDNSNNSALKALIAFWSIGSMVRFVLTCFMRDLTMPFVSEIDHVVWYVPQRFLTVARDSLYCRLDAWFLSSWELTVQLWLQFKAGWQRLFAWVIHWIMLWCHRGAPHAPTWFSSASKQAAPLLVHSRSFLRVSGLGTSCARACRSQSMFAKIFSNFICQFLCAQNSGTYALHSSLHYHSCLCTFTPFHSPPLASFLCSLPAVFGRRHHRAFVLRVACPNFLPSQKALFFFLLCMPWFKCRLVSLFFHCCSLSAQLCQLPFFA